MCHKISSHKISCRFFCIVELNLILESWQRGPFAGFSLYISNTDVSNNADMKSSTLCYKDGPQLPPLNFTTICTLYGRYVFFYNERLHGVIYPELFEITNVIEELCEVIVYGTCMLSEQNTFLRDYLCLTKYQKSIIGKQKDEIKRKKRTK